MRKLLFVLIPFSAFANAGMPMIAVFSPIYLIGLLPIILIEGFYYKYRLSSKDYRFLKFSLWSNLLSTFIGVPLTWLILLGIQLITGGGSGLGVSNLYTKIIAVTVHGAWLVPYRGQLGWMLPFAAVFLWILFFFASYVTEYFFAKKYFENNLPQNFKRLVLEGNAISYFLVAIVAVVILKLT